MADFRAVFESPLPRATSDDAGAELSLIDESAVPKHRVFAAEPVEGVAVGHAGRTGAGLVYSVGPGEWTVHDGPMPADSRTVDLTHVRAAMRLSGAKAAMVLAKLCSLDFDDRMFPNGAAARTSVAAVATEVVRDDEVGVPSYLLVPSRSFGGYLHEAVMDAGAEFGLQYTQSGRPPDRRGG